MHVLLWSCKPRPLYWFNFYRWWQHFIEQRVRQVFSAPFSFVVPVCLHFVKQCIRNFLSIKSRILQTGAAPNIKLIVLLKWQLNVSADVLYRLRNVVQCRKKVFKCFTTFQKTVEKMRFCTDFILLQAVKMQVAWHQRSGNEATMAFSVKNHCVRRFPRINVHGAH